MKKNKLGQTGLEVSPFTIGAWQLGGPLFFDGKPDGHPDPGEQNVIRMIHELGDLGVNAIDTAEQYSAGESERRVGKAIRDRRDQWVVSSKFGYRVGSDGTRDDGSQPETILPSLEGSLKRLGSDFIDVYLYHCTPERGHIEAGREVLEAAKQAGKIRAYGISTNDVDLLEKLISGRSVEVVQFASSLLNKSSKVWKLCRENNLGTQIRGVMAHGRLSGKYFQANPVWREDDNRSNWFKEIDFTRYAPLASCVPENYTMAQAAIRWVLDHPGCHTICMGAKRIEDYRAAIETLDLPPLSEDATRCLEKTASELG
jgi:aryl-alcohol dehydrogenase-like predicted oxidoreductase